MTYAEMERELEYLYRAADELQRQVDEYGALGYEQDCEEASQRYREVLAQIRELQWKLDE